MEAIKKETKKKFLQVFNNWKKENPERVKETIKRMKSYRKSRANVFGSDKQLEFRFEFTIPSELDRSWEQIYPNYMREKWIMDWLAKEFKELLRIPERW